MISKCLDVRFLYEILLNVHTLYLSNALITKFKKNQTKFDILFDFFPFSTQHNISTNTLTLASDWFVPIPCPNLSNLTQKICSNLPAVFRKKSCFAKTSYPTLNLTGAITTSPLEASYLFIHKTEYPIH